MQINVSGDITFSIIEGLKNSPDLLFYLAVFSLAFLVLGTIFPRTGDLGIMMAVGGNPWICVQLHLILIFLQTGFSFILANGIIFFLIPDPGSSRFLLDFVKIEIIALLTYFLVVCLIGIPSVLLATLKDPYSSIRRLK
ncbi:hypothetical protein [Leptospira sp. GIMC2001]|uniref:hypothetical protein n=1 Tax=Leptospira sp. GIMC2001 TaxID=1513297 RepID=UPI00234B3FD3|nr:hypothetical protein [Leptospira sp. GIMC2001]WCL48114.1 hypothetical protein O4O04_12400 [Leptospira sp. GIMC2001]